MKYCQENAWIIVVEAPCLDVVLGQLGVGQQLHGVGHQLHVVTVKLLQLQVNPAHLGKTIVSLSFCELHQSLDLSIKRIIVKQVGAVECLAVGLVESYYVLLTSEYFYLCRDYIILNTTRHM